MCSTSSKSTGLRSPWFWVLAFCFCLTPSGTLWAQDSQVSPPSSVSSNDFLRVVKELADSLTPDQRSKLTLILEHYKAEEQAQNDSLTKLSKSWEALKAKTLGDELTGDLISGALGFFAGYATGKEKH